MIRKLNQNDTEQVFGLMNEVYRDHSFLKQGMDEYNTQLKNGCYVSIGEFEGDKLRAHAGYKAFENYALMNALVVDPRYRGLNLGRGIFNARLDDITEKKAFDFVFGFSMMQHIYSQRLYDDGFKPIGIDIGYEDIYRNAYSDFNRGIKANAELVLCRNLSHKTLQAEVCIPGQNQSMATKILGQIGVNAQFAEYDPSINNKGTFLGFQPSDKNGLFVPIFLSSTSTVDFKPLVTSNDERQHFVNEIRSQYEQSFAY